MTPNTIKATFLRSRSQLLDTALVHLSENYYIRLSQDEICFRRKYLSSRNGTLLEGAIAFSQNERNVLVSVTPFDVAHCQQRFLTMNPSKINIPQPDRGYVLMESITVGAVALLGLAINGTIEAGGFMSGFITCAYYAMRVMGADDLGRKLRQAPSISLAYLLPDCQLPANENWLVVGDEIFTQADGIEPMALMNLCSKNGTGLLVFTQNDNFKVLTHPKHNRKSFETKFNDSYAQLMKG
jgi:hypothetical protein